MSTETVSATLTIHAPAASVFAILADPRQHRSIDGSDSVQRLVSGPERLALGSTFEMRMRLVVGYTMRSTVVEFEEGRLIAWRTRAPVRWRYELRPEGNATVVTETWDISGLPVALRVALRLAGFPGRTRRALRLTLLRLKAIAESAGLD